MQKKLCQDKNFEFYYIVLVFKWWLPKFLDLRCEPQLIESFCQIRVAVGRVEEGEEAFFKKDLPEGMAASI